MEAGMARVIDDIGEERQRQQEGEGWSSEHDDKHVVSEWGSLVTVYLGRAMDAALMADRAEDGQQGSASAAQWRAMYRHRMVQVAALAGAAIESYDRIDALMKQQGA